jgi:hypothetical protein
VNVLRERDRTWMFPKPLGLLTRFGKMQPQPPMWRNGRRNGLKIRWA